MNGDELIRRGEDRRVARAKAERARAASADCDGKFFLRLPPNVTSSNGWIRASHTARSLLIHIAQSGPNGKCSASMKYLQPLGWNSEGTVRKAVKELIECGLLYETRPGSFPAKSAWYAVTWLALKVAPKEIDSATAKAFRRGTYASPEKPAAPKQSTRTAAATRALKQKAMAKRSYTPAPSDGAMGDAASAAGRSVESSLAPLNGATHRSDHACSAPSDGAYLDIAISLRGGMRSKSRMGALLWRCRPTFEQRPLAYKVARVAKQQGA